MQFASHHSDTGDGGPKVGLTNGLTNTTHRSHKHAVAKHTTNMSLPTSQSRSHLVQLLSDFFLAAPELLLCEMFANFTTSRAQRIGHKIKTLVLEFASLKA